MKYQIYTLRLVYPPISNQEAAWLDEDSEAKSQIGQSNLYMICQQSEALFDVPSFKNESQTDKELLRFKICLNGKMYAGHIDLTELTRSKKVNLDIYEVELQAGERFLKIVKVAEENNETEIIDWFTPRSMIFRKSRQDKTIYGLDEYEETTQYHLHYVGISRKDSFTRLISKPHEKRLAILSNESAYKIGSRLTDELFHLFFRVDYVGINILEKDDIHSFMNSSDLHYVSAICDAEKAYVKILKPKYNKIKFSNYPRGADGLYGKSLKSYGFVIGESVTLITETKDIKGAYTENSDFLSSADMILIKGDTVSLLKGHEYDVSI